MRQIIKQKLSQGFIGNIVELCAGFISSEKIDKLFSLIESEISNYHFTPASEANLLRVILGMYNKRAFLEESLQYPHYIEILVIIAANSNYLTDILVRDPEYFYWIINPSNLKTKHNGSEFQNNISKLLNTYSSFEAKVNALKAIKRKEILRIGLNDLLGNNNLEETTRDLSSLARTLASVLFEVCYKETLYKYQVEKSNRQYVLVSLGKLGGNELNYSSDIDLMIFYDKNTQITKKKNYHEILTETILLFVDKATSITDTGYLYRVDFRLRPDGKNSPLCNTFTSYCNYYESRGEDWERQMLIKADYLGGSKSLYNKFISYISPFIHPASFDSSPLNQIRKLKNDIEKNLQNEDNIKLNPGGIRSIEFSVQALQLLNGRKFNDIISPNTLNAIRKLGEHKLLTKKEETIFTEAYIFYRRIEHFLQLMNDNQTHTIPVEGELLDKLSSFMKFRSTKIFLQNVKKFRSDVLKIYDSIIGEKTTNITLENPSEINFLNSKKAAKDYNYLKSGRGLLEQKQFDNQSIDEFRKIEPALIKYLLDCDAPDLVIQNFARVIRNAKFPSIWYKEFSDNIFFRDFLTICRYSQKSIDLFSEDKDLRDYFLSRKYRERLTPDSLDIILLKELIFHMATQFVLDKISPVNISQNLKYFFKNSINKIVKETAGLEDDSEYFIAALGSFGAGEMSFGSDIDLVFVTSGIKPNNTKEKIFQALLLKLKKEFFPFQVDCRLRPEGKSSQLCWELSAYQDYLQVRARIWELQAFCKLDLVAGNKILFKKFVKSIKVRIETEKKTDIRKDILEMRKKLYAGNISKIADVFNIKKERGALTDIEFACQYLILTEPGIYSKLRRKSVRQLLMWFSDNGVVNNADELIEGQDFLRKLVLANQVLNNTGSSSINLEDDKFDTVLKFLNFNHKQSFKNRLQEITSQNIMLFEDTLTNK